MSLQKGKSIHRATSSRKIKVKVSRAVPKSLPNLIYFCRPIRASSDPFFLIYHSERDSPFRLIQICRKKLNNPPRFSSFLRLYNFSSVFEYKFPRFSLSRRSLLLFYYRFLPGLVCCIYTSRRSTFQPACTNGLCCPA